MLKRMQQALLDRPTNGFSIADVPNMSAAQMRRALASVCPVLWTNEALEAMGEAELRQQLHERLREGVRYFDEFDFSGMSAEQLRTAIRNDYPGLFTDEQFESFSKTRLREILRERRRLGIWEQVCLFGERNLCMSVCVVHTACKVPFLALLSWSLHVLFFHYLSHTLSAPLCHRRSGYWRHDCGSTERIFARAQPCTLV